jgi:hypothetical protein
MLFILEKLTEFIKKKGTPNESVWSVPWPLTCMLRGWRDAICSDAECSMTTTSSFTGAVPVVKSSGDRINSECTRGRFVRKDCDVKCLREPLSTRD